MKDPFLTHAIEWHVRLQDGDDSTWEAFAEWLAQDARNAPAYKEVEELDYLINRLLPDLEKQSVLKNLDEMRERPSQKFGMWIGGAMAASLYASGETRLVVR